ncbi:hypothetical protein [Geomonas agri]|uniref:hypothetical protein n=1 Tax=Geomonas agri TaxID=2873702 RepID=UPI001CD25EB8|nr:hypothetical protein [Geomonas agri]
MLAEIIEDFFKEIGEAGIPEPQCYLPMHLSDTWLHFLVMPNTSINQSLVCTEIICRIIRKIRGEDRRREEIYFLVSNYIVELQMESMSRQKIIEYQQASVEDILTRLEPRLTVLDERYFKKVVREYKTRFTDTLGEIRCLNNNIRYMKDCTNRFWLYASHAAETAGEITLSKSGGRRLSKDEITTARATREAALKDRMERELSNFDG